MTSRLSILIIYLDVFLLLFRSPCPSPVPLFNICIASDVPHPVPILQMLLEGLLPSSVARKGLFLSPKLRGVRRARLNAGLNKVDRIGRFPKELVGAEITGSSSPFASLVARICSLYWMIPPSFAKMMAAADGPFRYETLQVNWTYLCHSWHLVSGQPPVGIRAEGPEVDDTPHTKATIPR